MAKDETVSVRFEWLERRGGSPELIDVRIVKGDASGLLAGLGALEAWCEVDPEAGHSMADSLLLQYIGDPAVTRAFNKLKKWYA